MQPMLCMYYMSFVEHPLSMRTVFAWGPLGLLQVSLLINEQTGGKEEEEKGREEGKWETCELRVLKTRLHLLSFNWLSGQHERKPPIKILAGLVFRTGATMTA